MTRYRLRSRLQRQKNKRLMRQSVLLLIATMAIVGLAIFYGIPTLIKLATVIAGVQESNRPATSTTDEVAPYPPQFSLSYEATASATIMITGFAKENTAIELMNNGDKVLETFANDQGEFRFDRVVLNQGSNTLTAKSVTKAGVSSNLSRPVEVVFDNTPPELTVSEPQSDKTFYGSLQQLLRVSGSTEPGAKIMVNERLVFVAATGDFTTQFPLAEGENNIKVVATDKAGNTTDQEIKALFYP